MKFSRKRNKKVYLAPEQKLIIKQVFFGLVLFFFLGFLIWGIWHLTRLPAMTISKITVFDGETIQAERIENIVDNTLKGDYWRLIPKRFTWFYPEKEVLDNLKQIERIKEVSAKKVSNTEITIEFSEYIPDSLWCDNHNHNDNQKCLFIDNESYAFGLAPSLTGESLLRYRNNGKKPQIGEVLMDEKDFVTTKKFVWLLGQIGWYVSYIEVNQVGDVFYILSGGGELRATLYDDPNEVFSYLKALLASDEFSHLKSDNFKYIDLRFGEKLYVNEVIDIDEGLASSTDNTLLDDGNIEGSVEG
ncbi:MAG: hypothetical protein R3B60_04115 [Candidatus Paceibacterota bacterium]